MYVYTHTHTHTHIHTHNFSVGSSFKNCFTYKIVYTKVRYKEVMILLKIDIVCLLTCPSIFISVTFPLKQNRNILSIDLIAPKLIVHIIEKCLLT